MTNEFPEPITFLVAYPVVLLKTPANLPGDVSDRSERKQK